MEVDGAGPASQHSVDAAGPASQHSIDAAGLASQHSVDAAGPASQHQVMAEVLHSQENPITYDAVEHHLQHASCNMQGHCYCIIQRKMDYVLFFKVGD